VRALFAADRLLPRLAIVCAMAACVLSGLGAGRLIDLVPVILTCRCSTHATCFFVNRTHERLDGAVAAAALLISALVAERIAKSDNVRLHASYLLASLGFLLALARLGLSAFSLLDISSLCR
jgi:hypothetical protein